MHEELDLKILKSITTDKVNALADLHAFNQVLNYAGGSYD